MGKKNIEKWSIGYEMLRQCVKFWHNVVYYKKVHSLHTDRIPLKEQIIFAPNHQNALMDALAVIFTQKTQPVFLARSDIFKKKLIAKFLYFIKILPVYRIRDGYAALKKNEEIFRKNIDVLEGPTSLVILPEGNHAPYRRLRRLKKGIMRAAFQAAEKQNFEKDVLVIPAGIEYSDYTKCKQELIVSYGEPVSLIKYFPLYRENSGKALVEATAELSEALKKQIIHIASVDYYDLYNELRTLFLPEISASLHMNTHDPEDKLRAQQIFIGKMEQYLDNDEQKTSALAEETIEYVRLLSDLNLRNWVLRKKTITLPGMLWRILAALVTLPLFLYGFLVNILPDRLTVHLADKVEDKVFVSSFKFVLSMLLFPLFHLVLTLIAAFFLKDLLYTLLFLVSLPVSGALAFRYHIFFKKFRARCRYARLLRRSDHRLTRLQELHKQLANTVQEVLS
jgi:1-acyl-sn-glycerol-3-phosphate acyltransferase